MGRGPLAAAADALGRVMLLDAASGAVLRVLKGATRQALPWRTCMSRRSASTIQLAVLCS